ncbi:hypothetical protein [Pseudofulvibacter geojedonensis]|uniref:DUF4231 domain-containing protein n=1 Tax=Pseudofulvibacter geojedonensis TaxID=1123758 RepID=A0ABW3HZA2_9FLAO
MKEFFKYQFGYINIDEDNLYMTTTGVWSETKELLEKSSLSKKANELRKGKKDLGAFLLVAILALSAIVTLNKSIGIIGFISAMGLCSGAYKVYKVFQKDSGYQYKIPRDKIKSIHLSENELEIEFLNAEGNVDKEVLKNIEEKGVKIIETRNLKKS